jgi:hypothetical protein
MVAIEVVADGFELAALELGHPDTASVLRRGSEPRTQLGRCGSSETRKNAPFLGRRS